MVAATVSYITHVAPFYFLFGIGMTLSFASQGAGRMKAPFFAGIARLIVATVGGWFAVTQLGWGLDGVFMRHRREALVTLRRDDHRAAAGDSLGTETC